MPTSDPDLTFGTIFAGAIFAQYTIVVIREPAAAGVIGVSMDVASPCQTLLRCLPSPCCRICPRISSA